MANDCLVTKLHDTVDNQYLPYIGWITVVVSAYDTLTSYKQIQCYNINTTMPFIRVKKGTAYYGSGLVTSIPMDTDIYASSAYEQMFVYLSPNDSCVLVYNPKNIWCFGAVGPVTPQNITSNSYYSEYTAWYSVDFEALAYSYASIIYLDYVIYNTGGTHVPSNTTIENLLIKKFRFFKEVGNRPWDKQTTGYIPCVRNATPVLNSSQRNITWRGEPFYNKHLYFNYDFDNDTMNVFDTATVVDANNYTVSNKIAEYNDTTKEWTYFE